MVGGSDIPPQHTAGDVLQRTYPGDDTLVAKAVFSHLYRGCEVGLSSAEVQVSPPSALTSTRTTARPPPATAYPLTVTSSSYRDTEDPSAGERIAELIGNCWIAGDCDFGVCVMAWQ